MPNRGEFDVEYENDAEMSVKDLVFRVGEEPATELEVKSTLLDIYNTKLDRRLERKRFIRDRSLLDYKRHQQIDKLRSKDEKEILAQIKPFARIQSPSDYNDFFAGLVAESDLVARLTAMRNYRTLGIKSMSAIVEYERERKSRDLARIMNQPTSLK